MSEKFDKSALYRLLTIIPAGTVITYGDAARCLGNPKWARAVGNALHDNPDGNKYPCYKVVNSQGNLSRSYKFGGIEGQKRQLENDGIEIVENRVDLKKYRYNLN